MKVSHKIKGKSKVLQKFKDFKKGAIAGQVRAVQDSTLLIHETAIQLISKSSGGTKKTRYAPKRSVKVSPPGKPPNTDTGRLVQSIQVDFKKGGLIGRVGTNLKYGAALEFGTSKMARRPWLSTAIKKSTKQVKAIFKKAVLDKAFKKTGLKQV